jgi:GH24 family phage-related lysozyme (muramidase)
MNMDRLLASVKKHEGYRNKVYLDTLGKRTVGVGHLCVEEFWEDDKEYEEKFLMDILEADLQNAINGAERLCSNCPDIDDLAKEIIVEMVFQLGETGVSKFKNMWKALEQDPPGICDRGDGNVGLTLGKTNTQQSRSNECGDGRHWLITSGSGIGGTTTSVTK